MGYEQLGKLGDVNTERTIPHQSEVTAVLTGAPESKTTPNGSPFIECSYQVKGGQFDGWKLKLPIWTNQTVKDGKEKSAFDMAVLTLANMWRGYFYMPDAVMEKGKETPESAAKRAPFKTKMSQTFFPVQNDAQLAQKIGQFVGKPVTLKVAVKPDQKGVPRNEIDGFVAVKTPAPA